MKPTAALLVLLIGWLFVLFLSPAGAADADMMELQRLSRLGKELYAKGKGLEAEHRAATASQKNLEAERKKLAERVVAIQKRLEQMKGEYSQLHQNPPWDIGEQAKQQFGSVVLDKWYSELTQELEDKKRSIQVIQSKIYSLEQKKTKMRTEHQQVKTQYNQVKAQYKALKRKVAARGRDPGLGAHPPMPPGPSGHAPPSGPSGHAGTSGPSGPAGPAPQGDSSGSSRYQKSITIKPQY